MTLAARLAVLAFEAALSQDRHLWAALSQLEQEVRAQQPGTRDRSRPDDSASVAERK